MPIPLKYCILLTNLQSLAAGVLPSAVARCSCLPIFPLCTNSAPLRWSPACRCSGASAQPPRPSAADSSGVDYFTPSVSRWPCSICWSPGTQIPPDC